MQRLLESRTPAAQKKRTQALAVAVIILVATYLALAILPALVRYDGDVDTTASVGPSPRTNRPRTGRGHSKAGAFKGFRGGEDAQPNANDDDRHGATIDRDTAARAKAAVLPGWGYNKDRNVPRWRAIVTEIQKDVDTQRYFKDGKFTLVDYGADQGYFSISCAKAFPQSRVFILEMGGVGGEIWKKKGELDVLQIQEERMEALGVENMRICQALVEPRQFFELNRRHAAHDYQLVLSVFHWFKLESRRAFERTVVAMFNNSRTTFIELPTMGDGSALIRQQVGWKYFSKWYDGRSDIKEILVAAGEAQGVELKVRLVTELPWVKWTRQVFRVDVVAHEQPDWEPTLKCAARRKVFMCKPRDKFSSCDYDE